jgi:hypothetical protein
MFTSLLVCIEVNKASPLGSLDIESCRLRAIYAPLSQVYLDRISGVLQAS